MLVLKNKLRELSNYLPCTLVELLVVISIIGIMLCLLLPAFYAVTIDHPKLDDRVQIIGGFFEGKSGTVVDKVDSFHYTVDIGDRKVQVTAREMKIRK